MEILLDYINGSTAPDQASGCDCCYSSSNLFVLPSNIKSHETEDFYCNPTTHRIGFASARATLETEWKADFPETASPDLDDARVVSSANKDNHEQLKDLGTNDLSDEEKSLRKFVSSCLTITAPVSENKQEKIMSESTSRLDLARAERTLEQAFANVTLLGQLKFTHGDYQRLSQAAREVLNKKRTNLEKIPDRVFLALMVFCARFEDISVLGFWTVFLDRLGLRNDTSIQNSCRRRFREVQNHLPNLYFPSEGYACVTPILYHTVIPQGCVPEMARLLRQIGQSAGWDAVAEMELNKLESHLPTAVNQLHMSKTISRFVSHPHSRMIATKFVYDLCEAAHLHQRGVFRVQDIDTLLEDHPIQREVWEKLMAPSGASETATFLTRAMFVSPRWQWDLKGRQMRLFFPRQNISSQSRPSCYVIQKEQYPVDSFQENGYWQVKPISLAGGPLKSQQTGTISVELRSEDNTRLREWKIEPLNDWAMFFQLGASGTIGSFVSHEKGLPAGDWLVLLRKNLSIQDMEGEVSAHREWYSPRGFEEYRAISVTIKPPVKLLASHDKEEPAFRIGLADDSSKALSLEGNVMQEADDPSGTPTYSGFAPDVLIPARAWDEVKNLQLQIRQLTTEGEEEKQAQIFSLQSLVESEFARWSETAQMLRVELSGILPEAATGRFRIKLLRGLQSAHFEPAEFNLVPSIRISPSAEDFDRNLFSADQPPQIEIACATPYQLTSDCGNITMLLPGINRLSWTAVETDFSATLKFRDFTLPLRWHPHILRSRISSKNTPTSWAAAPISISIDNLSFSLDMNIEGAPEATYQIFAGEIQVEAGRFNQQAFVQFPLAKLTDFVRRSKAKQVPIRIITYHEDEQYQLLLLVVNKNASVGNDLLNGDPIRSLRVGQQVLHPNYGLGVLEAFVEIKADGESIKAAKFQFDLYYGVEFFIPITQHLPVYGSRRLIIFNSTGGNARVRRFVVGDKANNGTIDLAA